MRFFPDSESLHEHGDPSRSGPYPHGDSSTKVYTYGARVQLPGRYDKQVVPKGSIVAASAHGYIHLSELRDPVWPSPYLWVGHVWVRDNMRGKGEGRKLYAAALDAAQAAGYKGFAKGEIPGRKISSDAERVWSAFEREGLTERVTLRDGSQHTVLVKSPRRLREFNACHNVAGHPDGGGRFCSGDGRANTLVSRPTMGDDTFLSSDERASVRRAREESKALNEESARLLEERAALLKAVKDPARSNAEKFATEIRLRRVTERLRVVEASIASIPTFIRDTQKRALRRALLDMTRELGVDPARVHIIDDPNPRQFEVGGRTWSEGGHYRSSTGEIQININRVGGVRALQLLAHEVMHAKTEVLLTQLRAESGGLIREWADRIEATTGKTPYRMNGDIRAEYRSEFRRLFPAHAAVADTWGHGYVSKSLMQKMITSDGFTDYSEAYWRDVANKTEPTNWWQENYLGQRYVTGTLARAMEETLAEVAAWRVQQRYAQRGVGGAGIQPSLEWRRFAARIDGFYRLWVKRGNRG